MIDQLNNPVWSALITGNRTLATGGQHAKAFHAGISPFVAVEQNSWEHYQLLTQVATGEGPVAVFTTDKDLDPSPWEISSRIDGYQMMFEGETPQSPSGLSISKLTEEHVPAMLELTRISPPGPFMEGTIRFGGYEGIFDGQQLVAMAGHRFHSGHHVEISAVCTHPDYTGRGYARALIQNQIIQIRASGNVPYLHVRSDNVRAYQIYHNMGFVTRTEMIIYILKK